MQQDHTVRNIPRCTNGTVRALCATQAKLEQSLARPSCTPHARSVRSQQSRKIGEVQDRGLEQLANPHWPFHTQTGDARKHHTAFHHRMDRHLAAIYVGQPIEEPGFSIWELGANVIYILRREAVSGNESKHFIQSTKDRELSFEWVLAKEHVEDSWVLVALGLPVRVAHGHLVKVRQQWRHQVVRGALPGISSVHWRRSGRHGWQRARMQR
jgi:hypothetical protein